MAGDKISYLGDDEQPLCKLDYSSKICRILVPRDLASWYRSEGARPQETRMDLSHFILKKCQCFSVFNVIYKMFLMFCQHLLWVLKCP